MLNLITNVFYSVILQLTDFMSKFPENIENFIAKLHKFVAHRILNRKYIRTGKCKGCGRCCQSIYVRHAKHIIQDIEEFKKLKNLHFFYTYLNVVDKTETGLVFECTKLDKANGKCTAYKNRPALCRQYPVEEIFMMGGIITEECGYKFTPIVSFKEVFNKVKIKNKFD